MKTLQLYLIAILLVVTGCQKKDNPEPEKKSEKLNLTQFFITAEYPVVISGKSFLHPFVIFFDEYGMCNFYDLGAVNHSDGIPYAQDGNKIILNVGSGIKWTFNLFGQSIISTSGIPTDNKNFRLHKVPTTNQFAGQFSGILKARENNASILFTFLFNQTQFGESIIGNPKLDYALTPIKNVFAMASVDNIKRYFLIVDGKVSVSRYAFDTPGPARFFYGTLTKD